MPQGTRLPANAFVATARRVYHPLGFKKGYNFILFVHTIGALLGFTLSRLMYLDIDNVFCGPGFSTTNRAFPGACYHYRKLSADRVGIIMHLACILPAALLVCLQFVPVIRHKFLLFHRINGYIVLVLSTVGIIAVFLMLRHSMGGDTHAAGIRWDGEHMVRLVCDHGICQYKEAADRAAPRLDAKSLGSCE
jgi:hypothetical protein